MSHSFEFMKPELLRQFDNLTICEACELVILPTSLFMDFSSLAWRIEDQVQNILQISKELNSLEKLFSENFILKIFELSGETV